METRIKAGFIGLGRMGLNMVSRILETGMADLVVYNRSPEPVKIVEEMGATGANSIEDLVEKLDCQQRKIWLMLPAGEITTNVFNSLLKLLKKGDIIIDGGNSNFHETLKRHEQARIAGIKMLDAGVSGGVVAAKRGYPVMVGGDVETYNEIEKLIKLFSLEGGYKLVGGPGAGHYVKMVHNAIEYGMMQAIGEGFELLADGSYKNLDLKEIADLWNHGTIISGFLMEMVGNALAKRPMLDGIEPWAADSGEGRWASIEAVEKGVPFFVNTLALQNRFSSQKKENAFGLKLVSAMRNEFGAHPIREKTDTMGS